MTLLDSILTLWFTAFAVLSLYTIYRLHKATGRPRR